MPLRGSQEHRLETTSPLYQAPFSLRRGRWGQNQGLQPRREQPSSGRDTSAAWKLGPVSVRAWPHPREGWEQQHLRRAQGQRPGFPDQHVGRAVGTETAPFTPLGLSLPLVDPTSGLKRKVNWALQLLYLTSHPRRGGRWRGRGPSLFHACKMECSLSASAL